MRNGRLNLGHMSLLLEFSNDSSMSGSECTMFHPAGSSKELCFNMTADWGGGGGIVNWYGRVANTQGIRPGPYALCVRWPRDGGEPAVLAAGGHGAQA